MVDGLDAGRATVGGVAGTDVVGVGGRSRVPAAGAGVAGVLTAASAVVARPPWLEHAPRPLDVVVDPSLHLSAVGETFGVAALDEVDAPAVRFAMPP